MIMTRMTSDIENLQQLLQDGLAQLAVQALTMVVITVILFTMNVELTLITLALVVPVLTARVDLVPHGLRARLRARPRRHRRRARRPLREPARRAHGRRLQPPALERRPAPQRRRRLPRRQQLHRPDQRDLRPRHPDARLSGPGALLAIGGNMVLHHQLSHRRAGRVLPVPEPLLRADPAARPAVQHLPAGPVLGAQAAHAVRDASRARRSRPTRASCRRSTGEIVFDDVSFGYDPATPVLRDVNLRIAPGRRSPSSGRPAPASRPPRS